MSFLFGLEKNFADEKDPLHIAYDNNIDSIDFGFSIPFEVRT